MRLRTMTPSVVPVTLPATVSPPPKQRRQAWLVGCFLFVSALFFGGAVAFAIPDAAFTKTEQPASAGPQTRPPEIKAEPAPVAAAAGEPSPAVPVSSLPKSTIEPDLTLVTFPPRAKGRRVTFDGVPLKRRGAQTMKLKCGLHTIKIGAGKTSPVQLPCGGETTLL